MERLSVVLNHIVVGWLAIVVKGKRGDRLQSA